MVEKRSWLDHLAHIFLLFGIGLMLFPVYVAFVASTHTMPELMSAPMPLLPGGEFAANYWRVLTGDDLAIGAPVWQMMANSLVMALGITFGKITISLLAAFAIVYFRFAFRMLFFWLIFITLMLPVEVRILPTYQVVASMGMLDSHAGLILPLIASATATFLFRQFFMTVPNEICEAARMDGAGPMRFFFDILLPMSRTSIAALFVILFIYGWNQYLWPLLVTTQEDYYTILIGINRMLAVSDEVPQWPLVMTTTLLAMIPPIIVVVMMQRQFVRGLIDAEK
ncbi:MAG: sn-glycerol-3-phosphate ABC transporter permease UgpE [Magnetococcales bacterium]|nr:sn-glycerol-3-phosphate ABC transporter permease UgpE [Magnetococcales bacterium]